MPRHRAGLVSGLVAPRGVVDDEHQMMSVVGIQRDALLLRELVDHAGNDGGQVRIPDRRRDAKSRLDKLEDLVFIHADHPLSLGLRSLGLRFGFSGLSSPSSTATYPSDCNSSVRSPSYSSPAR